MEALTTLHKSLEEIADLKSQFQIDFDEVTMSVLELLVPDYENSNVDIDEVVKDLEKSTIATVLKYTDKVYTPTVYEVENGVLYYSEFPYSEQEHHSDIV